MKSIIKILFLAAIAIALVSCGDDDDNGNKPSEMELGQVITTINDEPWEVDNGVFVNTTKSVRAEKTTGDLTEIINVSIQVDGDFVAGTYPAVCYYRSMENEENLKSWNDLDGSAEVNEVNDDEVSGTFSFTADNSDGTEKKVTGSFKVKRSWTGI